MTETLECPHCRAPLERTAHGWRCPTLHGIFLDAADLLELPRAVRKQLAAAFERAAPGEAACARCDRTMEFADVGPERRPIRLDRCAECGGTWFDAHELTRVTRMLADAPPGPDRRGWLELFQALGELLAVLH